MIDLLTAWRTIFILLVLYFLLFGVPILLFYGVVVVISKVVEYFRTLKKEATK